MAREADENRQGTEKNTKDAMKKAHDVSTTAGGGHRCGSVGAFLAQQCQPISFIYFFSTTRIFIIDFGFVFLRLREPPDSGRRMGSAEKRQGQAERTLVTRQTNQESRRESEHDRHRWRHFRQNYTLPERESGGAWSFSTVSAEHPQTRGVYSQWYCQFSSSVQFASSTHASVSSGPSSAALCSLTHTLHTHRLQHHRLPPPRHSLPHQPPQTILTLLLIVLPQRFQLIFIAAFCFLLVSSLCFFSNSTSTFRSHPSRVVLLCSQRFAPSPQKRPILP